MVDALADVYNLASDFFSRFDVAKAQMVADGDRLFHQDEGTVGIHNLGDGFFGERRPCGKVTPDNDVNGKKDALAAANGAGF